MRRPAAVLAKSRAEFARAIREAYARSREAVFDVGRLLIAAKRELPHGQWTRLIDRDLPFGSRYAQMFMKIASDPRLSKAKHASLLPASPATLYEISKLSDVTLATRIADGTINPTMERRDIATVVKVEARAARELALSHRIEALPDRRYGVIYADPEWRFETWSRATGLDRSADNHYPTSDLAAIMTRPVASIAAPDCVLLLWSTPPMERAAHAVLEAWGFTYRAQLIWHKIRAGDMRGTGYWFTGEHEILLVGTIGNPPAPAPGKQWRSVLAAPVGDHSVKPATVLDMIEAYWPHLPKIELNRRGPPRPGWDAWGNETTTEIAAA